MKFLAALLALGACTKADPPPSPPSPPPILVVPVDSPPVVVDAPPITDSVIDREWPALSGALAFTQLDGPFRSDTEICARLGRDPDHCQFTGGRGTDEDFAALPAITEYAELRTYVDVDPAIDHTLDTRRYLAFKTARGWWVTGRVEGSGGGRGSFGWSSTIDHQQLEIRYALTKASSGKWSGTDSYGIAICGVTASDAVRCTQRVVLGEVAYSTPARECPGCTRSPQLACEATLAHGTLTISPMTRSPPDTDDVFSTPAAAACRRLPYVGAHATN